MTPSAPNEERTELEVYMAGLRGLWREEEVDGEGALTMEVDGLSNSGDGWGDTAVVARSIMNAWM